MKSILAGVALAVVIFSALKLTAVKADEAGNHRIYLTGYNTFQNEDTTAEIFRDSKTNTEFICFRHQYNAQDNFSCVQLDPTKVVKP